MTAQELKNSILQLAVQGKLVEQRLEEGTAKELLSQIKAEKEQLMKDKKIKKEKPLPEIADEEKPFDIPETWIFVRVGEIGSWSAGATPSRHKQEYYNGDIPWLKTGDLNDGFVSKIPEFVSKLALEKTSLRLNPVGSVLMAMYGATIGKLGILQIEATTNQACCACIPYSCIINKYLFYYLMAQRKAYISMGAGGAQPNISKEKIVMSLIALPPLEEQKRIVSKIEEILPYIEQYDKAYTKLEAFNKKFPEDMRKSVLQLAVQGKLVEQRLEEGTAEELYQQIVEEKANLIKEGKIKKEKPLAEISDDEIPFEIPDSWKWVRFAEIASFYNGDRSKNYPNKNEYVDSGVAWINTGHITKAGYLDKNSMNYITEEKYNSLSNGFIQPGDMVYCLRGATFGKVARVEPFEKGAVASSLMIIRLIDNSLREYIYMYLKSPIAYKELRKYDNGSAQPNLAAKDVEKYLIPLPPLKEQKRIVTKIEEILPYCEQLVK